MSYLGNSNLQQSVNPGIDYFSGDGVTQTFQFSRPVYSLYDFEAVIENVVQNPSTAFTINTSSNQITFTSAPPSGTNNIYVRYLTRQIQVFAPAQGTVTPASLSTGVPSWDSNGNLIVSGNLTVQGTTTTVNQETVNTSIVITSNVFANSGIMKANTFTANNITSANAIPVSSGGTGVATITGLVKGSGTSAFTAATAGTDYLAPGGSTIYTSTFSGNTSAAAIVVPNIVETANVSAIAASGTINYDVTSQSVLYYTSNASGNFTINFRGSSGASLNTILGTGQSVSTSFLCTNGATPYYNSVVQVDGTTSGVTTKWQGGSAPTSGDASSIDVYNYVIMKTGSATFTVLASVTKFA